MIEGTKCCPRRPGIKDMWNAKLVVGAKFDTTEDMPICPSNVIAPPRTILSWSEAKERGKLEKARGNREYFVDAFVHFYEDDQRFDGPKDGIWAKPDKALDLLSHFSGIITPDFSTYLDFPKPILEHNTYRMRSFGFAAFKNGLQVINNVRWGNPETWSYCFAGIPEYSMVAIGTVGSDLRRIESRPLFTSGFIELLQRIKPHAIVVVGSANLPCFGEAEARGIEVIQFDSPKKQRLGGGRHE